MPAEQLEWWREQIAAGASPTLDRAGRFTLAEWNRLGPGYREVYKSYAPLAVRALPLAVLAVGAGLLWFATRKRKRGRR